ncbi:MAG: hypothetical protein NWE82_00335 [Candidatus Bathyarchaeota archaeon]|nr:hypothetical protein [Candidatus Bathyarchaeota archaeon]
MALMKIPTTVLLSTVLVITSLTTMAMPTFNANITNFPTDEQGNLKVSSAGVSSKVVTVIKDQNFSWTEEEQDLRYVTAEVAGYNEMVVYLSLSQWTAPFHCWIDAEFEVDGIVGTGVSAEAGRTSINMVTEWTEWISYGLPASFSALYHIQGVVGRIIVAVGRYWQLPASGWVLVSVSLYLRN